MRRVVRMGMDMIDCEINMPSIGCGRSIELCGCLVTGPDMGHCTSMTKEVMPDLAVEIRE